MGFSALTGRGVERLMPTVFETYDIWNKRARPTPKLNRWLREMETLHPPPLAKGRRIRLRFMTQIKTRPPTFMLSVSQPDELPDDYLRYPDQPACATTSTCRACRSASPCASPTNPFASRARQR